MGGGSLSLQVPCFLPELLDRAGRELGKSGMGVEEERQEGRRKVKEKKGQGSALGDSEGDPA